MTPNQCGVERLARVATGIGFACIAVAVTPAASELLAFIGIIISMTGVLGWCPIYGQLGVSSQAAFARFLERRLQPTPCELTMLTPVVSAGAGGHSDFVSFEPDVVSVQIDGIQIHLEPGQTVIPHGPDRELTVAEALPGKQP